MKKRILSLALALSLILAFVPAATAAGSGYTEIVSPKYDEVRPFSDGMAAVAIGDWETGHKWGFIDKTGKEIVPLTPRPSSPPSTASPASDFDIRDGVLVKYNGSGGNVVIPEGVVEIEKDMFRKRNITRITFPSTLVTIGQDVLWNCNGLTSVTIPESVKTIRTGAFAYCYGLKEVHFLGNIESIGRDAFIQTPWRKETFSTYDFVGTYGNGGFTVKRGNSFGLAGLQGEEILPCEYSGLLPVRGGGFEIEQSGVWALVDADLQPIENDISVFPIAQTPVYTSSVLSFEDYSGHNTYRNTETHLLNYGYAGRTATMLDSKGNLHIAYEKEDAVTVIMLDENLFISREFSASREMPKFGTATIDTNGNYYLLFGKDLEEDQHTERNVVIVKYSPTGTKLGSVSFVGFEGENLGTKTPFNFATASMAITDNILAAHFGRSMFKSGDGLNHQASKVLYIDIQKMEPLTFDIPYTSHSFEQQVIATRDGGFLFADKGDAHSRGFTLCKLTQGGLSGYTPFHFRELSSYQDTAAALGGIAESDHGYLLAGTSDRVLSNHVIPVSEAGPRDLFIQMIKKNFSAYDKDEDKIATKGAVRKAEGIQHNLGLNHSGHSYFLPPDATNYGVVWLTSYPEDENAASLKLVAIDNGFALLWERWQKYTTERERVEYKYLDTWYMLLNADSSVAKAATKIDGNPRLAEQDRAWFSDGFIYWANMVDETCTVNSLSIYDIPINSASAWARGSIKSAITSGFVPEALQDKYTQEITRAEFCALAVAVYEDFTGKTITTRKTFTDTKDPNVEKAAGVGIVGGTNAEGTLFSPNITFNREMAAALLVNLLKAMDIELAKTPTTFNDKAAMSGWTLEQIGQVQAAGLKSRFVKGVKCRNTKIFTATIVR